MNIIIGPNAEGKTTILEGISLLTNLKSLRTHKFSELIQHDRTEASVSAEIMCPTRSKLLVGLHTNKRFIKVDHQEVKSQSKYPFLGSSVSFIPDDLYLIKGSPDQRREFIDELGTSLDPTYSKVLQKFDHTLKQRNKLLKSMKTGSFSLEEYALWTEKFVESAVPVYESRIRFVKILNDYLPRIFKDLFKTSEDLKVIYKHSLESDDFISDALYKKINQLIEAERAVGYSLAGPHRDDLEFLMNELESKSYSSQGQIRGIVIALKIAQLELTKHHRNWSPVLLLDDIISELDDHRVRSLVDYLSNYPGQLFVTTAEVDKVKTLHQQFSGFKVIDLSKAERIRENTLKTASLGL